MVGEWTFGGFLWAMFVLYFWVLLIWMFISIFANIVRRQDLNGWAKAAWILLIVVLPFIGILAYVIVRTMETPDVVVGSGVY